MTSAPSARPTSSAAESSRLRLRMPPPTPRRTRWWQRWFRRFSGRVRADQSDTVANARIARTVTIATGLITAAVGIAGNLMTTDASKENSIQQRQSESERSATEFLRKQRQDAYNTFATQVNATLESIQNASRLVEPFKPLPTSEEFERAYDHKQSQIVNLSAAGLKVELVASDGVCVAMHSAYVAFVNAGGQHVDAAQRYVEGKPLDDGYRKVWMTNQENDALLGVLDDFITAAREDLSDLVLRKPAKNCG